MPQIPAKAIAEQKFRDADGWRLAFELSAHRYQTWFLLWISRRSLFVRCMQSHRIRDDRLTHLSMLIDEAHDFALTEIENMRAAARNTSTAELVGRIYYEEYEESRR